MIFARFEHFPSSVFLAHARQWRTMFLFGGSRRPQYLRFVAASGRAPTPYEELEFRVPYPIPVSRSFSHLLRSREDQIASLHAAFPAAPVIQDPSSFDLGLRLRQEGDPVIRVRL
jgi:hypothetical protein